MRPVILQKNICAKKYITRSVIKALANSNNNININPNVLKNHKYILNLKNSISTVRKTINTKNLKIEIPINNYGKKNIFNNILK